MHTKLYGWLVADRGRRDVATLNEKIYAELFVTPRSDPWLGLMQPDVYTGRECRSLRKIVLQNQVSHRFRRLTQIGKKFQF